MATSDPTDSKSEYDPPSLEVPTPGGSLIEIPEGNEEEDYLLFRDADVKHQTAVKYAKECVHFLHDDLPTTREPSDDDVLHG